METPDGPTKEADTGNLPDLFTRKEFKCPDPYKLLCKILQCRHCLTSAHVADTENFQASPHAADLDPEILDFLFFMAVLGVWSGSMTFLDLLRSILHLEMPKMMG